MNTLFICALKKGKNSFAFLKNYNIPGVSLLLFYNSLNFRNNTIKKNKPSYLEDLFFSASSIVRSAKIDWASITEYGTSFVNSWTKDSSVQPKIAF